MRPVAISLSPNTQRDDVRNTWRVLLHPRLWKKKSTVSRVARAVSQLFDGRFVTLTSSGRQALYQALQAAGIGREDEVIIQAFTCIAVPAPIRWSGAKPVYADIDEATYNMDVSSVRSKITERTKAIIVQHTFGIPADIAGLRTLADEHNILLIEDCAHALGAKYNGKTVGTFGDIAIVSFGRDKMLSCVFGGAVVSQNKHITDAVYDMQQQLPYPPAWWVIQQLLHPIVMNTLLPWYFVMDIGKVTLVLFQKLGLLSKAVDASERLGYRPRHIKYRFSPALGALLKLQLKKLPTYTHKRRAIARAYMQYLSGTFPVVDSNSNPSWLRVPIQMNEPHKILKEAQRYHMLLGDWYNAPLVPASCSQEAFGYTPGSCPAAERAAAHVINLPTYPVMTQQQVDEVISFVGTYSNES